MSHQPLFFYERTPTQYYMQVTITDFVSLNVTGWLVPNSSKKGFKVNTDTAPPQASLMKFLKTDPQYAPLMVYPFTWTWPGSETFFIQTAAGYWQAPSVNGEVTLASSNPTIFTIPAADMVADGFPYVICTPDNQAAAMIGASVFDQSTMDLTLNLFLNNSPNFKYGITLTFIPASSATLATSPQLSFKLSKIPLWVYLVATAFVVTVIIIVVVRKYKS